MLVCVVAGCTPAQVEAFKVDPPQICRGQPVTVSWRVKGRAELDAMPAPPNWAAQVASEGSVTALVEADTSFTIHALDAKPARGRSYATQWVRVAAPSDNRSAPATCDGSGKCVGSIQIDAAPSVRVRKVATPSWKSGFKTGDHAVCVTAPSGERACLEPKTSAPLDVAANGAWHFETTLAPGESGDPPPELRVFFDFGCG